MTSTANTPTAGTSVVFGGGGLFGIAYNMAVAEQIGGAAVAPDTNLLGTSAGSWAAAALCSGVSFADMMTVIGPVAPTRPEFSSTKMYGVAVEVFADASPAGARAVACSLPGFTRVVLDMERCGAAHAVAASSAVPGLVPPYRLGSRLFIDGGARSMVSADLAFGARNELIVVVPVTTTTVGSFATGFHTRLRREIDVWLRQNTAATVTIFQPDEVTSALVGRPWHLFDPVRAQACYDLVRSLGDFGSVVTTHAA